jgi:uncharacterized protein YhdP
MELAKLSGELTLIARNGQFLKIQSGAGKLLGLISLQSLPRRQVWISTISLAKAAL